jgi:hypothetical protein
VTESSLDLAPSNDVFATHQRRFFDAELPPSLSAKAFAAFNGRRYSRAQLTWGRRAWELRALDEYRSYIGFSDFLTALNLLGASFDVLSTAVRTVRDEARHVELCRRLVLALGGTDRIPGTPSWVTSDAGEAPLMRALRMVMGSLCVGETLSCALLIATRDVATDPLTHEVLTVLAADESVHSQVGWTLLPMLWPKASKRERAALKNEMAGIVDYARQAALDENAADGGERSPFGELFASEREKVFKRSLEHDVLRRFRARKIAL